MARWFLIVLLFCLTGCGGRVMNVVKVDRHGHYRNDALSFCLHVPETWEMREDLMGQVAVFLSPDHGPDHFRENLVVSSQSVAPDDAAAVTALREDARKRLAAEIKDFKETGSGESPEGYPWLSFTHAQLGKPVTALVYFAAHNKVGLVLTFSAPSEEYAAWEADFRKIPATLKQDLSQCPPEPSPGADTPTPAPASGTPAPATPSAATPSAATPEAATPGTATPEAATPTPAAATPTTTP